MSDSMAGAVAQPASLADLLERAGVTRSSIIRLAGSSSLPALLWLCRHGYDQVGCLRAGGGLPHEDEPDAILATHTCGELELKLLLPLARQLRPGGVFVFRLRTGPGSSAVALEWLLKQVGLSLERRVDTGRRALVVARRTAITLRKAA